MYAKVHITYKYSILGKEKYPTLVFECVVDHSMKIHSCSKAYHGAVSDKEVVMYDCYARNVAAGMYKDYTYHLYDENGVKRKVRGLYFITDNGYPDEPPIYIRYVLYVIFLLLNIIWNITFVNVGPIIFVQLMIIPTGVNG